MQADSPAPRELKYKRIILKLSGEVLKNPDSGDPIDPEILLRICKQLGLAPMKILYDLALIDGQIHRSTDTDIIERLTVHPQCIGKGSRMLSFF